MGSSNLDDPVSDYGSDLDEDAEQELAAILGQLESCPSSQVSTTVQSFESREGQDHILLPLAPGSRYPPIIRGYGVLKIDESSLDASVPCTIQYDELVEEFGSQRARTGDGYSQIRRSLSPELSSNSPDTRTPLERFRTAPKKPLSVTDLVSPAWCELQYWYSLTKYGRKKRTPAMEQGSVVHKVLEDQVYTTVPVDVHTREDSWGLKLWNMIQGLRTLRTTGMTRELEMWGILDGQIVNGKCDELSYTCTDPVLEAHLRKDKTQNMLPNDQSTISDFFGGAAGKSAVKVQSHKPDRRVYITDVKTRMSATLPSGSSLRPTTMQLMIYSKLLADLADGAVDASIIFDRFKLKPDDHFSDSLVSQLAGLDLNLRHDSTEDTYAPVESLEDTVDELLAHNSLNQLWQLMIAEYKKTFVGGASSISRVLRAEFRNQKDGKIIGTRSFVYNEETLQEYVQNEMKWWKGEREAQGVEVSEAFKCRSCEFAETCSWRINKVEEATRTSRAKTASRRSASG